jgi:hypothetical protein
MLARRVQEPTRIFKLVRNLSEVESQAHASIQIPPARRISLA